MLDRMTLLLRFQAIAAEGSLRRAAESLNVTQPALSRSIEKLEAHYGQPLLERHARGVRPTGFGRQLLEAVARLARDWRLAEDELALGNAAVATLRINAGPLWAVEVLPRILGRLQARFPKLHVEIADNAGAAVVQALADGSLDVSFGGLQLLEISRPQLEGRAFTSVHDRVIAREGHPIHADDRPEAVLAWPWIVFDCDPVYGAETLHSVVERTGVAPTIRLRSTSLVTVLRLLEESDYLCMLPDAAIAGWRLRAAPVPLGRRQVPSGALYRSSMAAWPPLATLLELCAEHFAEGRAAGD